MHDKTLIHKPSKYKTHLMNQEANMAVFLAASTLHINMMTGLSVWDVNQPDLKLNFDSQAMPDEEF